MRLYSFDGLDLTQYGQRTSNRLSFYRSQAQMMGMAGVYDQDGREQRRELLRVEFTGTVVGATQAAVDTALDALKAKANLGLGWLVAEMRDSDLRGTWAKLARFETDRAPENILDQEFRLLFEAAWPWWEDIDDVWYLDAGYELDDGLSLDANYTSQSGAGTFAINNTGDDVITRGLIFIEGASTNPTITNNTTGESISYAGSVASGETLKIDLGAQTVELDGIDAYDDVSLGSTQIRMMSLAVGSNSITFSGGGDLTWHWARVY